MTSTTFLDWFGALGQGIGAVGSLAAAGVALWLGIVANKRADAAQRASEVSYASTVSLSVSWSEQRDGDELFKQSGFRGDGVRIENHGASPVFNPYIERIISTSNPTVAMKRTNEQIKNVFEDNYRPPEIIRPGGSINLPFELRDASGSVVFSISCEATISFRDTLGIKWVRTGTAPPQRVEEQEDGSAGWKHGKGSGLPT